MFGAGREYCVNVLQKRYNISIDDGQFCAIGAGGSGTCQGDQGAPLMAFNDTEPNEKFWYLAGLTSLTSCDLEVDVPTMATKVSYYYDWILTKLKE